MDLRRALDGLLLDVGGPIMRTPFEFVPDLERGYGLPAGTITWRGPFSRETDPLWRDHEAGVVGDREYWTRWADRVQRAAGMNTPLPEFLAGCYRFVGTAVRDEATLLVTHAKAAGMKVGALTNDASWLLPQEFLDRTQLFSDLDVFVDLSEAAVRKPHPQAYAIALDALGLPADRVLFVDDQPLNVAGAQAVGIEAVHFDITDVAASVLRIEQALGIRGG